MIWWLIYNKEDIEINQAYIHFYFEECKKYDIELILIVRDRLQFCIKDAHTQIIYDGKMIQLPNTVINRSRDYLLSKTFENIGCNVYNNSEVTLLGNNKFMALQYASNLGIDIMPTYYGQDFIPPFPFILKSISGHGGKEVFYIQNDEMLQEAVAKLKNKEYIIQEIASDIGKDLRVYIIGNKIVASMLRISDNDFRSNYCLGGRVIKYELNDREKKTVYKILDKLKIGHCGIDFIFHNGRIVFNEIEDVVGSRMLYQFTDINVVSDYVKYIRLQQN